MNLITSFLLTLLLITSLSSLSLSARSRSDGPFSAELKGSKGSSPGSNSNDNGGFGFGPGPGFNIPGFGNGNGFGGGYGYGYGGPKGGHNKGGIVRPTVVCTDRGPCYKKKLTCPAKCFSSYSRSGKGYGGGGGGGGCTMDCKKKCVAYC